MPIKYKVVARQNPADRSIPPKYYAQAVSSGKTSLRSLAQKISQISTVSTVDTMATLEALLQLIPAEIANGNIVKLGEFGNFGLTISSEGADSQENFAASKIKKYTVRFRPGKLFKNVIDAAGYEKE
ncbi:MAG TPA: HU family DNA-binding protein [bacterium]